MRELKAKTWVEVSRQAIGDNLRELRARLGAKVALLAVVKANAYGHGLIGASKIALRSGAAWLGTDSIDEALALRKIARSAPILILGYSRPGRIREAVAAKLRLTVYNPETLKAIARTNHPARVHLKLETGTTRQGVDEKGLFQLLKLARRHPKIAVEGLSTHYANIEDTTDHRYASAQLIEYVRLATLAEKLYGQPIPIKHTACSAAAILFPETHFTMARVGIALYGLWPSRETMISARERGVELKLTPALTWKTVVAQVKSVRKGTPISYGLTVKATRKSKIAVVPVGYWDGFDRKLSAVGEVLVRGHRAPLLGRVCMNMFMADVTDIPSVKPEDEVVLVGSQGKENITPEEIAQKIGTINYEVISRINPQIKRVYL